MSQQFVNHMLDEIRTTLNHNVDEGMQQLILYLFHEDWNIRKAASQIFAEMGSESHSFLLGQADKESDLEKLIEMNLSMIVRYKVFVNDVKNLRSFSCNWMPGKGREPYVKKEKFSEFENI